MIYISVSVVLDFLYQYLIVFVVQIFHLLGRFIPRFFTLFDAMINDIVSLISLSVLSLLVYRNTTNFCVILYPATLLNLLVNSSSLLVAYLQFSMFAIFYANSDGLTSFPIWIPFISFLWLLCIGLPKLCWINDNIIVRVDILFLFLRLEAMFSTFTFQYEVSYRFIMCDCVVSCLVVSDSLQPHGL